MTIIEQDFYNKVPRCLGDIVSQLKEINAKLGPVPDKTKEKETNKKSVKTEPTPGEMLDRVLASIRKKDLDIDFTLSTTLKGNGVLLIQSPALSNGIVITDKTLEYDIMRMENEIDQEIKDTPF